MFSQFSAVITGYRGIIAALLIGLCATFLSSHYGGPAMLFALLIGMAFNFLSSRPEYETGIVFSSKTLLRIGVACLGFRLSLGDVVEQGWQSVAVIIALVLLTILSAFVFAPFFKRSTHLGILTGGAVAICGASAALAISAAMPKRNGLERDTLFTVVAVTTLSTIAMVAYPLLFTFAGFDESQAGFLIGATIHDVAQVVGAGFSISEEAGNIATLTKLQRVLLLPVVIIALTMIYRASDGSSGATVPLFVILFVVFVLINSTGFLPAILTEFMVDASRLLLVTAIAALGMKTKIADMLSLGGRHILLVVSQTLLLLGVAVALVSVI